MKREIHGIMTNGERVYLGASEGSDDEFLDLLNDIAISFKDDGATGFFNVKSSVYRVNAFAGIQVTPPIK